MSTIEIFREICKKTVFSSLGETAGKALLFFLERDLGEDPFYVFWRNPEEFYRAMKRILGAGTKVLVNVLVNGINKECGLNISPEHFLELMQSGDQRSIKEIRSFLMKIAESYRNRGGVYDEEQQ